MYKSDFICGLAKNVYSNLLHKPLQNWFSENEMGNVVGCRGSEQVASDQAIVVKVAQLV